MAFFFSNGILVFDLAAAVLDISLPMDSITEPGILPVNDKVSAFFLSMVFAVLGGHILEVHRIYPKEAARLVHLHSAFIHLQHHLNLQRHCFRRLQFFLSMVVADLAAIRRRFFLRWL